MAIPDERPPIETERILAFVEQASEEDRLAMDALANFLREETAPPRGSVKAWTERPYLITATLLTAGITFDSRVGSRFARVESAVEKHKYNNPEWRLREMKLHPEKLGEAVLVRLAGRDAYYAAKRKRTAG